MFEPQTSLDWATSLLWLGAIAVVGFLASWVLTGLMGVRRPTYVGVLAAITAGLAAGYLSWSGGGIDFWTNQWAWGLLGAVVTGGVIALGVSRAPVTAPPRSMGAGAFVWDGLHGGARPALRGSVRRTGTDERELGDLPV